MIRDDITHALASHTTVKHVKVYHWLMKNTPGVDLTPAETQAILERMRELE